MDKRRNRPTSKGRQILLLFLWWSVFLVPPYTLFFYTFADQPRSLTVGAVYLWFLVLATPVSIALVCALVSWGAIWLFEKLMARAGR